MSTRLCWPDWTPAPIFLHDPDPISLDTRVKGVTNTLFYDDLLEVVLIGHSYQGMVITEVAAREPRRLTGSTGLPRCLPASRGEKQIVLWLPDQKERYLPLPWWFILPLLRNAANKDTNHQKRQGGNRQRKTHQRKKSTELRFLQVQPKPTNDVRTLYNGLGLDKDPRCVCIIIHTSYWHRSLRCSQRNHCDCYNNFIFQSFPFHLLWHAT